MPHAYLSPKLVGTLTHFRRGILFSLGAGACLFAATALLAQNAPKIPTVNANVGGCTADFIVMNGNHKPLYSARVDVKFRYGLFGMHKISLTAYTNSKGEARFEGLPDAPKKPLAFRIHYDGQHKTVADNPGDVCNEEFRVTFPQISR